MAKWRNVGSGKAGLSGLFLLCVTAWFIVRPASAFAEPLTLELSSASLGFDLRTNEPIVVFRMTADSGRLFAEFTAQNVGRKAALKVDGRVISAPVIREPIVGGSGQLSGHFSAQQAQDLAERLSSGRSRLEVEVVPD